MQNTIDLNLPVAQTIAENPDVKALLVDLGFAPLANPAALKTVGRVTSLKTGAKLTGISLKKIRQTLEWNGYSVIDSAEKGGGAND